MTAVAANEPAVPAAINQDDVALVGVALEGFAEAAGQQRHTEAARIVFEQSPMATDDEVAALVALGCFEAMAHYVPVSLQEMGQAAAAQEPDLGDPSVLSQIAAPVLLLHGAKTGAWATDGLRYLADQPPHFEVREIPDAAHFGPLLAPEAAG